MVFQVKASLFDNRGKEEKVHNFFHWYVINAAPVIGSERDSLAWGFLHGLLAVPDLIYHAWNHRVVMVSSTKLGYSAGYFVAVVAQGWLFVCSRTSVRSWRRTRTITT